MKKLIVSFLAMLVFTSLGHATTVQVTGTGIANNSTIDHIHSLYSGSFNLGQSVPNGAHFNSAQAIFRFSDNTDQLNFNGQTSIVTQPSYMNYQHTVTTRYYDPNESLVVKLGNSEHSGNTSSYNTTLYTGSSSNVVIDHYESYSYSCGTWNRDTCYGSRPVYATHTYNNYTQTSGSNGAFDLTFDILPGSSELQTLNSLSELFYQFQVSDGDLVFLSATLTADYTPVPEPTTLVLCGIGLIGVGLLRRKMNK